MRDMEKSFDLPDRVATGKKKTYEDTKREAEEKILQERKEAEKGLMTSGVVPPELREVLK
ncbi:hypothetical protein [uncultured Dialister sp.]|jgi:hypothetical protein|uniref:hypothetical protein n=1 Tax=uncultured Dialister sp. TaxID=278064 RepID=UPI0020674F0C|nr:hypothetical protein [uncultured Dialister sp.]DAI59971.1 MAG TPA: hypothetical protein [Caudoviricetes sp.]